MELDREILLAGVNDVFRGELVLAPETLHQVLAAAEESQAQTRTARIEEGARRDKMYVASFRKEKGVKSSPSGFWYRVEYAGDEVIPNDAVVDVVVKETLTDGTVIQDMEVSQRVMSQRLSAYPPLFREAIGYVKNHGTVTLVVPPELAYGDEGYPPKVLPGATMVYELRVSDVSAGEV